MAEESLGGDVPAGGPIRRERRVAMARAGTPGRSSAAGGGAGGIPPSAAPRPSTESPAGGGLPGFGGSPARWGRGCRPSSLAG